MCALLLIIPTPPSWCTAYHRHPGRLRTHGLSWISSSSSIVVVRSWYRRVTCRFIINFGGTHRETPKLEANETKISNSRKSFVRLNMVITLIRGTACAQHVPARPVDFRRATFFEGTPMLATRNHALSNKRAAKLEVQNFKFMKDLGFKKPAFLPDFGLVHFLCKID